MKMTLVPSCRECIYQRKLATHFVCSFTGGEIELIESKDSLEQSVFPCGCPFFPLAPIFKFHCPSKRGKKRLYLIWLLGLLQGAILASLWWAAATMREEVVFLAIIASGITAIFAVLDSRRAFRRGKK